MLSEQFRDLGLSEPILKIISKRGFVEPSGIQKLAIPLMLNSSVDIIARAKTGTGKTAAFGLPIIERLQKSNGSVQALVLVPTRELALQVSAELNSFRGERECVIYPVYGGQSMPDQIKRLKKGADIVVGTPGRIKDHLRRKTIRLESLSVAVLDEADEMLNMGFIEDVRDILANTNPERRTLLFSATMPAQIMSIAREYMKNFTVLEEKNREQTVSLTDQKYIETAPADRFESLCRVIDIEPGFYGLVFCRTRADVDSLALKLQQRGYNAEGIHGELSQQQRERALAGFRKEGTGVLVATDVAARGIDINDLTHVINFSLPQDTESYIHRIGRTGRAGRKGTAISFISPVEQRRIAAITRSTGAAISREKVPAVTDIINVKRLSLSAELGDIIECGDHRDYMESAASILTGRDPLELVAAMLKHSRSSGLNEGSYREIKECAPGPAGKTEYKHKQKGRRPQRGKSFRSGKASENRHSARGKRG